MLYFWIKMKHKIVINRPMLHITIIHLVVLVQTLGGSIQRRTEPININADIKEKSTLNFMLMSVLIFVRFLRLFGLKLLKKGTR